MPLVMFLAHIRLLKEELVRRPRLERHFPVLLDTISKTPEEECLIINYKKQRLAISAHLVEA
jgi:hypothetical protein